MGVYRGDDDVEVRFKIISGDRDKFFKAEERLVGDFWFLLIRTRTGNIDVLNRERKDKYVLEVRATATKRDGKKGYIREADATVVVTVLDTNDLNPLFYPTEYLETVPEDLPVHSSVIRVFAEDADLGENGEIYYSFQESSEQFAVHPTTGVITLTRPLRFSEKAVHELTVLARDRGTVFEGGGKPITAKLKITVKQVNLHSPEIHVHHLPDIVENSNADIYAIVKVIDRDTGIHGEIQSLDIVDGDPDGHFRIRPSTKETSGGRGNEFTVEVLKLLDRETAPLGYNLTLRASDKGTPPRQTYTSIPVHLADLNDNAPVFDREIYEVDVPETSPINSPIIRLKVTDADQGRNAQVFLEIVGGNEGGEFHINPDTGMLYTSVCLDAEQKSFYTLTVSAIDQGNTGTRKQSSAKVKVQVVDTNDNDPLFDTPELEVLVDENEPAGTSITKVTARDKDSGENAYISYSIANLNPVPFEIDHFTGIVKTTKVLDFESMRRHYVLHIRASDWGSPYRRQTEMQLKIKIRDVNDNRPQFEKVDCVGHLPRFVPIGTEIITLSAIDFDAGNIISYRTVSGNEDGCFNLDAASGVLSVTCDLSDIFVQEREINITATDGTHFADVTRVKIKLVNAKRPNDPVFNSNIGSFECKDTGVARRLTEVLASAEKENMPGRNDQEEFAMMPSRYGDNVHTPEFINFPNEIQVNESVPLRRTIVRIRARDRDLGYNGNLVFGITSGDNDSVFRLEPDTGELKVIGYLDRERETEYLLNITVYDQGKPQKSTSKILPITVLDVNDNAPKFERALASFRVTENAHNGTAIFRLNATDADLGENAHVSYSLVTDTDHFRVDPGTGVLYVSAPLDREKQEVYELKIRATDRASNPKDIEALYSEALVRVFIDDINDNAPTFPLHSYTVKAREDIPVGSVVAIIDATDPDLGQGGEIRYSLLGETEVDIPFVIDRLTGTVRTSKPLDYEERQVHTLTVRARDRGTPSLLSEVTLVVDVADVNENLHAPVFEDFVIAASVLENQPVGTLVTTVTATDADAPGDDSRVGYSIRAGDGLGYFSIDEQGNIRTLTVLDAETKNHFWLTVYAQDHGVAPLHTRLEVYVSVGNVNDNVPLSLEPVYYPHVTENSPANTPILQVTAQDADLDPDQTLTYRITAGNPESFFNIDTNTGVISTTGRKLDRENQSEHILEVTVSDNGSPPLSSTTRVVVIVDDVNDNAPQFEQSFYHIVIPESRHHDSAVVQNEVESSETELGLEALLISGTWESLDSDNNTGEALFRVLAVDRDEGFNGQIHYSIKSGRGKGKFGIHPTTGVVYSQRSFVAGQEYDLLVRATDNGSPNKSTTARISVQVMAIPENSKHPPVFKQPDQRVEVTESDIIGFLVALVQATDEDGDLLWYKIVDGDVRSEFLMGGDAGSVLLAKQLDWETQQQYNLTISVTDGIHTVSTQLYVSVIDINEHRPWFSQSLYAVNVSESTDVRTELLRLNATDIDQDNKVVYSLYCTRSPSSQALFKVDYQTGAVSVVQPLDRESIAEHILTVMVKDQGTPAKRNFARVVITVYDANDHTPEWTGGVIQGRVLESAAVGTAIITVLASDKDHGHNAALTYSIVSGNVGNAFTLDPNLGILRLSKELDIASMAEYMLIVKATDGGNPPLSASLPVHIMVVMADNAPPRFSQREVAAELYEREPAGTVVKHLEARSTSSLLFELIRGNSEDMFSVNPSTGVVTTKRPLDYEATKVYNLSITATNMAGAKAVCQVIVHVLDRNDNAPQFLETIYLGRVYEDASIGSLVHTNTSAPLVITAHDLDSQVNALLQYDIVEPAAKRMFHIDSTTGAIRTVMILDYETMPYIEFNVRVTDLGKPRLSSDITALIHIDILDVNDCAPAFTQSEYNASVLLPTYKNVAVVQLNATDRDSPALTSLQYAILSGNQDNIYRIVPGTGLISVRDTQKGSRTAPHRLKISVTDGRYTTQAYVNIRWERSSDSGLVFQRPLYHGAVLENSTKPLTVAVVNVVGSQLNEHLVFSILNPSPLFKIGRTSGAVSTTGVRFDREMQDHYQLIVQARSEEFGDAIRVAQVPVNITVLDINDNCPMFVNLPYYAVVSVDAQKGDVITKVHAVDLDSGENGEVRYELVKGHGELFRVCRKTGEISLKQSLESHNRDYQLIIAAYDGGMTPCSTEVSVSVKVVDRSMPVFDKQFYAVSTPEDIQLHSPLPVSIKAESPLGRKLIYSIVSGNQYEEFAVDFSTGVLHVVDELDYETTQQYALTVRATDSISGVFAEVLVSVLVTDVNDCPPEFPVDAYNVSVSEAAPFGSLVLKVIAKDNDTGVNSVVRYSLDRNVGNASDYFHVDPEDGSIYLKRSLDHEVRDTHHLVVIASDTGVPSLSTSVHVWLTVIDMNDNAPKFEQTSYTCWLSEEASRGQLVTLVSASDPDLGSLQYSIAAGNQHHTFAIDAETGIITVINLHKLTEMEAHTLNVSVSDGVYTSFCRVRVEMISANQHSPVIEKHQYDTKVTENLPAGTLVIKVVATDKDSGVYGQIAYSIPSHLLLESFTINNVTGEVWTKRALDREQASVYEIPVMATDGGGRSGLTTVRLTVVDINDNTPQFQLAEYKACIHGNLTVNFEFLKVKAMDADEGLSAKVEYSVYETQSSGVKHLFGINRHTGALFLLKSALPYENQVFQFFVRATDCGTPALHADVPVQVYIMGPHDIPPVFQRRDEKFFISENAPTGSVITRVKLVTEMPVEYRLIGGGPVFSIDADGEISVSGLLDREATRSHNLGILALTHSSPPLTALTEISLQVLDTNDNPPKFHSDTFTVSIPENVQEGTPIFKVLAYDQDEGSNGEVRYALGGEGDVFAIDPYTGWITTLVSLDRETTQSYTLTLIATDNGSPPLSASAHLHIRLVDYNDNPPVFTQESYTASVKEDALAGTVVVQLAVTDLDTELISSVEYYITAGDPHSQFAVRATGQVYVARPLDRETQDSYHLTVTATDAKFVATTHIHVDILDANDEQPHCLRARYREVLSEGVATGSYVFTVLAADADLDPKLKFYLTGEGAQHFSLDRDSGELKTSKLLDREEISHYQLTAHVQDREIPDWECTSHIDIILSDVNDNPPSFSTSNHSAMLPEDSPVGTLVTKMHATDQDRGINRRIRYYLVDSGDGHFEIAAESGLVRLAKPLDRETQASYTLTVKAVDQGTPQLWSVTKLQVLVLDVNDNPPEFVSRSYHVTIPESASVDTEVARVMATSLDTGLNAQIVYSILGGNEHGKFSIDPQSGVISIAEVLDYERSHNYLLTVQATDLGVPPLSNQATVNITVTDSNDNAPVFTQLSYSAQVREHTQIGDIVLQVTSTDVDSGNNGKVGYTLERGDRHQQFSMDPNTGHITVARPLDREMVSSYVLQVRATDFGVPQLSSFALVNVDVLDTNDNPPLFLQPNYTAIVQEDKLPGWPVCQLTVSDADIFPNSSPFTFDILSGDPGGTFRIEPDGTVRTAARLNYRLQDTFLLHVRVFDNGTPPLYSDTWVTVKVIEESQFPPVVTPLEVWVGAYQERWSGGELGRVAATDQDQYDTLVYSLSPPTPPKLFTIEPRHGVLTAAPGLDTGRYLLNVSVSDGKYTSHAVVVVTVQPLWDDMLQNSVSIRFTGVTPHHFVLSQRKGLMRTLKAALMREVSLISVQPASHGDLDVLIFVTGGVDMLTLNEILNSAGLSTISLVCDCQNGALCRQRIQFEPESVLTIATDVTSFVAPGHSHELYCSCGLGYAGDHCEETLPSAECVCPTPQMCVPQQSPPGYLCVPPFSGPPCSVNHTCPPSITSSIYSITWEELIAICIAVTSIIFLVILFILYRRCRKVNRVTRLNKSLPVLNPDVKRTSKLSNLEVTQRPPRPASYTSSSNNEVYSAIPLNNLDTLRSYGSAGDELENVPPDYRRNLNRNTASPGHKINNDLKRVPELPRRAMSCVEDDARTVGGYHWDCSDWVRPSQNPLPNITEVPGSEVPDSSSFHSNDSNESTIHLNIPVDPARDLATLDEELYLTYRSEEDVIPYGFPASYPSHSDLSTNVCDIEDSDVPS